MVFAVYVSIHVVPSFSEPRQIFLSLIITISTYSISIMLDTASIVVSALMMRSLSP